MEPVRPSVPPTAPGRASRFHMPRVLPGLAAAVTLAAVASAVSSVLPVSIGAVPLAVVLGLAIGHRLPRPALEPGYAIAIGPLLRTGIVLLGAELSLTEVARVGVPAIGLVLGALLLAAAVVWSAARLLGVTGPVVVLLGVGSAVCGNTAILATAPALRASRQQVALAVTGITLWGTVGLLAYPLIGRLLGLPEADVGLWVGLAIQDTSQVVAAGAAHSDEALRIATVVKLVRNSTLLLILPLVARLWQRRDGAGEPVSLRASVPLFVLGFLAMATLRSIGLIEAELADFLGRVSGWAVLVAVAGLGLGIELSGVRRGAGRSLAVAGVTAVALGAYGMSMALLGVASRG